MGTRKNQLMNSCLEYSVFGFHKNIETKTLLKQF